MSPGGGTLFFLIEKKKNEIRRALFSYCVNVGVEPGKSFSTRKRENKRERERERERALIMPVSAIEIGTIAKNKLVQS
jgi:hypothetical protein